MAYYPKSKILTNQVAAKHLGPKTKLGTIYWIYESDLSLYEGPYYKLYNGEMYTGKFPGDGPNSKLLMVEGETTTSAEEKLMQEKPPLPLNITTNVLPLFPTEQDYKSGMFIRYFSKKRNEYLFEELTKDQYDKLNNPKLIKYTIYKPFYIKWMLTGGDKQKVADYNYYSIRNAEEKEEVLGLNEFLKMDYLKYYK